jgi:hypothetical protein
MAVEDGVGPEPEQEVLSTRLGALENAAHEARRNGVDAPARVRGARRGHRHPAKRGVEPGGEAVDDVAFGHGLSRR